MLLLTLFVACLTDRTSPSSANATCSGFTFPEGGERCWLYPLIHSLQPSGGYDWYQKPGAAPAPAPPPPPCTGSDCFSFSVDWASGSAATTLPTANFSVRKLEAVYYPPDGQTYAYLLPRNAYAIQTLQSAPCFCVH